MDVLVPCRCLHCSTIEPGSMPLGLCSSCRQALEPATPAGHSACDLCAATLAAPARRCIPCLEKRTSLDRLVCSWRYQEPFDAVIHALKFGGLFYLGEHLAASLDELLEAKLEPELDSKLEIDAVVPVPLHWRRAWRRGYNQAAEIARPLARRRGWRLEPVLRRRRCTRPQSGLDRTARRRNLDRAFVARAPGKRFEPRGKRLLLIDDVYTTGATLEAAARALESAGAHWVGAAVAARTPRR